MKQHKISVYLIIGILLFSFTNCDRDYGAVIGSLYDSDMRLIIEYYDYELVFDDTVPKNYALSSRTKVTPKFKTIEVLAADNTRIVYYPESFLNRIRQEIPNPTDEKQRNEFWVVSEKGLYLIPVDAFWKEYVAEQDENISKAQQP